MAYDPGWDMPQQNWQQQGSFESGEIPPAVSPDAGTQICIGPIAQEWLGVILGALDQLRNPSTWLVPDDATMYQTLRRVDLLREIIATGDCGGVRESGKVSLTILAGTANVTDVVTFSDVYSAIPIVVCASNLEGVMATWSDVTLLGFTLTLSCATITPVDIVCEGSWGTNP
jgi:hypothetical protein